MSSVKPSNLRGLSMRGKLVQKLKNLLLAKGYPFVKRGPIVWANFPWDQYRSGVAILVDDSTLFGDATTGAGSMTLSLEMFTKLDGKQLELDEGTLDKFVSDAKEVLTELIQATDEETNQPFVLKRHTGTDNAVEAYDAQMNVQGLVITIRLDY